MELCNLERLEVAIIRQCLMDYQYACKGRLPIGESTGDSDYWKAECENFLQYELPTWTNVDFESLLRRGYFSKGVPL